MKNSNQNISKENKIKFNTPIDSRTRLAVANAINEKKTIRMIAKYLYISKTSDQRTKHLINHNEN
jgi:hypothetical protein